MVPGFVDSTAVATGTPLGAGNRTILIDNGGTLRFTGSVDLDNLTIDGLTVAATLFTINSCSGVTVNGYVGHHAIHGMSTAIWDSTSSTA